MEHAQWDRLVRGTDCPFDVPRQNSNEYWDLVAQLAVSSLYLAANQIYRGQCLLILDIRHATRPEELSKEEWGTFCADLYCAEAAIAKAVHPDHINVAALGNVIPHLHWHIIPRYRGDPRWGAPIWTTNLADIPEARLADADRAGLLQEIRNGLTTERDQLER
ncbi:MAG TPA: HIT family protein [Steroidobacteraceae bacterium]